MEDYKLLLNIKLEINFLYKLLHDNETFDDCDLNYLKDINSIIYEKSFYFKINVKKMINDIYYISELHSLLPYKEKDVYIISLFFSKLGFSAFSDQYNIDLYTINTFHQEHITNKINNIKQHIYDSNIIPQEGFSVRVIDFKEPMINNELEIEVSNGWNKV